MKPDYTDHLTDIQFKKRNFKEQNGLKEQKSSVTSSPKNKIEISRELILANFPNIEFPNNFCEN